MKKCPKCNTVMSEIFRNSWKIIPNIDKNSSQNQSQTFPNRETNLLGKFSVQNRAQVASSTPRVTPGHLHSCTFGVFFCRETGPAKVASETPWAATMVSQIETWWEKRHLQIDTEKVVKYDAQNNGKSSEHNVKNDHNNSVCRERVILKNYCFLLP